MDNPLARDLDHVLDVMGPIWDELRGARLFLTGGTGFFGCWLLETLTWANERRSLGASAVVLTRNAAAFHAKAPHLARQASTRFVEGDLRTFPFPDGAFTHVIHAGVDASVPATAPDRLRIFDTIAGGTQRTLEFAARSGARRFLYTSSGAVYGRQPASMAHVDEDYTGAPDSTSATAAGAEAKRAAEMLCALHAGDRLQPLIARCFAFVGPYLPLSAHLAAGNFLRDALAGGPIQVAGDGTPIRSYLYAADLAIWLWTILLRGQPMRAYNVGSEAPVSIAALAQAVAADFSPPIDVRIAGRASSDRPPDRYVPGTARARAELGLSQTIALPDAIRRTTAWHRQPGK
jgi:nucleoside-diphosphate-sugar epimerase